ncbi:MAG: O-antigen ligase family protein [Bacteroidetes bacterium]|nr:O-antigen ligase family protein [Bacteroidota bacterium]
MPYIFTYDSIKKYLNYAAFALLAIVIFSVALANITGGIAALLFILLIIFKPSVLKEKNIFALPFLILAALRTISVFTSVNFAHSSEFFVKELPFYALLFVFFAAMQEDILKNIRTTAKVVAVSGVAASLLGMANFFFRITERAASLSYGPITLGVYLTFCLTFIIFLKDDRDVFKKDLYWYLSVLVIISGIIVTFNRTHWIAIALLILFYAVYTKKYIPLIVLLAVFIAAVFVVPGVADRLNQLLFLWKNMSDRDILWKGAMKIIFDKPFLGFGPNTFTDIFMDRELLVDKLVKSWHNEYIQVYIESGIFALGVYLYMYAMIIVKTFKAFRMKPAHHERNYLYSIFANLFILIVFGGVQDIAGRILFMFLISIFALYLTFLSKQTDIDNGQTKID